MSLPAVASPAQASDLLVVDAEGRPVPGVEIRFVDQPLGAFGDFGDPVQRRSNDAGRIALDDLQSRPLDLAVAGDNPAWAVRFVHGLRQVDESASPDLLGALPSPYETSADLLCVVEPTGTLRITVRGASPDDRFHAAFIDKRPEPESHRNVQSGGSFTGGTGTLRVPAGRGNLYLAKDGYLGAQAITSTGPLMVTVTPGGETHLDVAFLEGPTSSLQAPFDMIPFRKIEGLAPDGETVVATWNFEASPLRLESRIPVVRGAANSPAEVPPMRLPKHLLRAVDVPLALPPIEMYGTGENAGVRRMVDRAPMELLFTVDPGDKVRLSEVASGWIQEAQAGLALVSGAVYRSGQQGSVERRALGQLALPEAIRGEPWTAAITVNDAEGKPLPFVEALVAAPGALLARGITDAKGQLSVTGVRTDTLTVGLFDAVADHVTLERPAAATAAAAPSAAGAITQTSRVHLSGTWKREAVVATVGDLMVLIPTNVEEMAARRPFMTRAVPIAFLDADGHFDFGPVPRGVYTLRAGRSGESTVDLRAVDSQTSTTAALTLKGAAETFTVELREVE